MVDALVGAVQFLLRLSRSFVFFCGCAFAAFVVFLSVFICVPLRLLQFVAANQTRYRAERRAR
jgi:hypothetical protein